MYVILSVVTQVLSISIAKLVPYITPSVTVLVVYRTHLRWSAWPLNFIAWLTWGKNRSHTMARYCLIY